MYRVDRMIYKKPKRFNWFYKKLGYVRPGSIEIPGCFWLKNQNRTVRSSMGDCHSFDPGSNPGPGAYFYYYNLVKTGHQVNHKFSYRIQQQRRIYYQMMFLNRVHFPSYLKPNLPPLLLSEWPRP